MGKVKDSIWSRHFMMENPQFGLQNVHDDYVRATWCCNAHSMTGTMPQWLSIPPLVAMEIAQLHHGPP